MRHIVFSQHPSAKKDMNVLLAKSLKQVAGKVAGRAIRRADGSLIRSARQNF